MLKYTSRLGASRTPPEVTLLFRNINIDIFRKQTKKENALAKHYAVQVSVVNYYVFQF